MSETSDGLTPITFPRLEAGARADCAKLVDALEATGHASVTGCFSGPRAVRALDAVKSVFTAETTAKAACVPKSPFDVGYGPHGRSLAGDTGVPNLLESWTFGLETGDGVPATHQHSWRLVAEFGRELRRCALVLARAIECGLGVPPAALSSLCARPETLLALNYLGASASEPDARRQSVHTDSSVLTLLPPASAPGLVVRGESGEWFPVEAPVDGVVVLAGSVLDVVTDARIPACVHTVETPDSPSPRTSLVLFVSARTSVTLSPIMSPNSDRAVSATDHRDAYFQNRFAW